VRAVLPPGEQRSVDQYVQLAAEYLGKGRPQAALDAARAACFAQPKHLLARMLMGQALLGVDKEQGTRVLRALSQELAHLEPNASVPSAGELMIGQLSHAVRLLLDPGET
jgi:hypothetical protein